MADAGLPPAADPTAHTVQPRLPSAGLAPVKASPAGTVGVAGAGLKGEVAPRVLVLPAIVPCLPWHLRGLSPAEYQHGGACTYCGRDVAAPRRVRPACLYCAMDRGLVPAIEAGPGVTTPACFVDRGADDVFGFLA